MHTTRLHPRRPGRSRLRSILLVGGAAVLSAVVVGMWRRSGKTVPTQAVSFSETEMRERLLKDLPVTERRLDLAGVSTSLLEGGEGPPLVLLHGQGGFAAMWGRIIPHLVGSHHVVAPDLPGLGRSEVRAGNLDARAMVAWLGELIEQTCAEPPVLVGHSLGGSFAAHFAIERGDQLQGIVLVDSGSLAPFRPAPGALAALVRYIRRPSAATYDRFSRQVFFDPDRVRYEGGERWEALRAYHIDRTTRACVPPTVSCCGASACGGSHPISCGRSTCPLHSFGAGTTGSCASRSPRGPARATAGPSIRSTTAATCRASNAPRPSSTRSMPPSQKTCEG